MRSASARGALLFLLLAGCSARPVRSAPAARGAASSPTSNRIESTSSFSPILSSILDAETYRDRDGKTWSLTAHGSALELERTPALDGLGPWLPGVPLSYQLRPNGEVFAKGVISDGTPRVVVDMSVPERVPGLAKVRAISLAGGGTCALIEGGKLVCFVDSIVQEEGEEYAPTGFSRSEFVTLATDGVVKVRDGCFLRHGRIHCYLLFKKQGAHPAPVECEQHAIALEKVDDFCVTGVDAGCARMGGDLWCWGKRGPRAERVKSGEDPAAPRRALLGKVVTGLQCAGYYVAALTRDGEIWYDYVLGYESGTDLTKASRFPLARDFALTHSVLCTLSAEGGLSCCGAFGGLPSAGVGSLAAGCQPALLNASPSASLKTP